MSDHHDHAEKETIFEADTHKMPSAAGIVAPFAVLFVLAFVSLAVGFSNLGPEKVWASLSVTVVQVTVLGLFGMELRQADKLTWLCVGASLFWTVLLFLFTMTDYFTRHYAAY